MTGEIPGLPRNPGGEEIRREEKTRKVPQTMTEETEREGVTVITPFDSIKFSRSVTGKIGWEIRISLPHDARVKMSPGERRAYIIDHVTKIDEAMKVRFPSAEEPGVQDEPRIDPDVKPAAKPAKKQSKKVKLNAVVKDLESVPIADKLAASLPVENDAVMVPAIPHPGPANSNMPKCEKCGSAHDVKDIMEDNELIFACVECRGEKETGEKL